MNCVVCDTEIQEGDLKIAHCQHRFHSICFLIEFGAKLLIGTPINCPTCYHNLFEENEAIVRGIRDRVIQLEEEDNVEDTDDEDENEGARTPTIPRDEQRRLFNVKANETYKELYTSSEPFRNEIKAMKTTIKEVRVLKQAVIPLVKQKETELKQKIDPLVKTINSFAGMIKSTRKTIIKETKALPEVKAFIKKRTVLVRQYIHILRVYGTRRLYLQNVIPGVTLRYYSPFNKLARPIRNKHRYI
jgi:hypothetical protein